MFQTACFVLFLQSILTGIFDAFHYTGRLNVFVYAAYWLRASGYFAAKKRPSRMFFRRPDARAR